MTDSSELTGAARRQRGFLGFVEKVGNVLPDPIMIFVYLIGLLMILSAIGGIWVPLYIMPDAMRAFGRLSPLNWSMEAYNVVLLRDGRFGELAPFLLPLLIFTAACILVAILAERSIARR